MKEYLRSSLRGADMFISKLFPWYRIPYTGIHYWEKRFDMDLIESLVKHIGNILDDEVGMNILLLILQSSAYGIWISQSFIYLVGKVDTLYTLYA